MIDESKPNPHQDDNERNPALEIVAQSIGVIVVRTADAHETAVQAQLWHPSNSARTSSIPATRMVRWRRRIRKIAATKDATVPRYAAP
jgi:hypothetical protein